LTGWDCNSRFIDPMCGSGTFLIEAAMKVLGRVPGYYRNKFGFMRWLDYDAGLYHGIQDEAKHIGLKNSFRKELFNGAIDCRLLKYDMYAGSK
jgi:23S rRNA G2445 N2-methylase RlmL